MARPPLASKASLAMPTKKAMAASPASPSFEGKLSAARPQLA
jgi:hypothetical protein